MCASTESPILHHSRSVWLVSTSSHGTHLRVPRCGPSISWIHLRILRDVIHASGHLVMTMMMVVLAMRMLVPLYAFVPRRVHPHRLLHDYGTPHPRMPVGHLGRSARSHRDAVVIPTSALAPVVLLHSTSREQVLCCGSPRSVRPLGI